MATLPFQQQASLNLQKSNANPENAELISTFGRLTLPLFYLMAFAGIDDVGRTSLSEDDIIKNSHAKRYHLSAAITIREKFSAP